VALSDLLELVDLVDLVRSWRFFIPTAVGVGAAIWLYTSLGESSLGAVAAVAVGLSGLVIGLVWQVKRERLG
jgi:hypothetical protein